MQDEQTVTTETRKFTSSAALGQIADALAKAQGEIHGAKKDANNPFFHSKYADLASVWDACRGPLSAHGLAVIQLPGNEEGRGMFLDTILTHSSGEWISSRLYMQPVQDTPQGIGSAITYARRYGLQAIVGIAPEDDDGNAASGTTEHTARQSKREEETRNVGHHTPIFDGDWREVPIHFGKDKGKTLGALPATKLKWYQTKWTPQPWNGNIGRDDSLLRAALDASLPTSAQPDRPVDGKAINGGNGDDDEIPGLSRENHKILTGLLEFNGIKPDLFMDVMREKGLIPQNKMTFDQMPEAMAQKFAEDFETVRDAMGVPAQ